MLLKVKESNVSGRVRIPGSKSHTIRALFISSLALGTSNIAKPLISDDSRSAVRICRNMGADIKEVADGFTVTGFNGRPKALENIMDVGNSGTTLLFALMAAALGEDRMEFTGDYQIRRRPVGPLVRSINDLGAMAVCPMNNNSAPVIIRGRARGGRTELDAVTSQYLSSILISAPLLDNPTEVILTRLNEVPYVEMTLWWLDRMGIKYQKDGLKAFYIPGGQKYSHFDTAIPGDFSSATFFAVLAAVSGGEFVLENLDMTDTQGDKQVFSILQDMGAQITYGDNQITIKGGNLKGIEIDMNAIPDALPAMAVLGCFAEGETRLVNVAQARLKETDRISVMCRELTRMGADIKELTDGLVIRHSKLKGAHVHGHDDHRIVMALAVAGLNCEGETVIDSAEAMNVTFPEFVNLVGSCGGTIELTEA
jgi:3-phosphoshikimate 1-carboxyvinyltransferase